jgi:hypothetical protein
LERLRVKTVNGLDSSKVSFRKKNSEKQGNVWTAKNMDVKRDR